ncbi:DUF2059 domain-containing protein [Rubricoccus marinus]|uniref:DUF2059 domain-containing protein n=1 Tax=Rubricoccus marinus TaxID=716817 RepID=A0A259TWR0_9BACT|nr:DUF2059 domain-containing protein [Rubricoccus marinus]OZC02057.1 hypothetical protein BSZ36_03100 [Rubricoccus marinus]
MKHLVLFLALFAPLAPFAQTSEATEEAVRELLALTGAEETHERVLVMLTDAIAENNAAIREHRAVVDEFYARYYPWAEVEAAQIAIYSDVYTEAEIRELIAWYRTPIGQKSLRLMPELQRRLMEAGQDIIRPHIPELETMLLEAISPPPLALPAPKKG